MALQTKIKRDIRRQWTGDIPLARAYRQSETLMKISVEVQTLKDIFRRQVLQIAFQMRKEGTLAEPALEWDGSLGPEEEKVIERLGFLLNAYTVQAWYPICSPYI